MDVRFLQPGFLFLLLLVPLVVLVPRPRDLVHAGLRVLVLVFVVLALARPVTFRTSAVAHQVFVVDYSASVPADQATAAAQRIADAVRALPDDQLALIVQIGDAPPIAHDVEARRVRLEGTGTPLGAALAAASRAIPAGARAAVTLITDARATARAWGPAAQDLVARGIPVHALEIEPPEGDVFPVGLSARGILRVGQTARLVAEVVGMAGDLVVRLVGPSGELDAREGVRCDGRVSVVFEFEPDAAGFLGLAVEVTAPAGTDARTGNERLERTFAVQDPLRLLYLGERMEGGSDRLEDILGQGFQIDEGSEGGGEIGAGAAPSELARYDLVVLDDRPAASLPDAFQSEMIGAVQEAGVGLFMAGGEGAFGPGGWHDTPVAEILPVEFVQKEEKRDPSTTLVVIIDTSGSMGGNRVQLAKEVARLSIRRLLPHDKVGIVEFYGAKRWAAPIQPASNSIELERALNRLDAGGGTVILPAIEEAFYGLQNVRTRYKHVLVLTDGGVERGSFEPLLRRMADEGINVSTVLVGPDAHSEFLVAISNWGKGRFYSVPNRFNLPEILLKQPTSAKLPAYRPGTHVVEGRGGPRWWGEQDPGAVPAIAGYVETRCRPGAEPVLETANEAHPVLASWRYGLGRVTTFATEPTGPGTRTWQDWDGYGAWLARVLSRTAADAREPFAFRIERAGHEVHVIAERRAPGQAHPDGRVLDETGNDAGEPGAALVFRELAPGLFRATAVASPHSEVRVVAGVAREAFATRLVSPAQGGELLVDPRAALDLAELSRATGGTHVPLAASADFAPEVGGPDDPLGLFALWPLCLVLALLLWFGDLGWRRRPTGA